LESNLRFPLSFQLPSTFLIKTVILEPGCSSDERFRGEVLGELLPCRSSLVLRHVICCAGHRPSPGLKAVQVIRTAVLLALRHCWPRQLVGGGVFSQLTSTIWFPLSSSPLWTL